MTLYKKNEVVEEVKIELGMRKRVWKGSMAIDGTVVFGDIKKGHRYNKMRLAGVLIHCMTDEEFKRLTERAERLEEQRLAQQVTINFTEPTKDE